MGAKWIYQKYQGYTPWPGIFAYYENKRIILEKIRFQSAKNHEKDFGKIFKNESGEYEICLEGGNITLEQIKVEGKKSQKFSDFVNGNKKILQSGFDK